MSWYLQGPQNPGTTGPRAPRPPKVYRPPKPKAPHRPVFHDPFAPTPDATLRAQSSASAQAALGPVIKAITDAISQRSTQGQAAITGYTHDLANAFSGAGAQTKAAYDEAQGQQNQVNTALANRLGSFGQNLAGQQGASLASINAPAATNAMTAQTGQTATGASNAGFAQGSAEVGRLIAQSAAGQTYGAKLPGIAGLTGLQNSRNLQAQLNHELADQLGQARAQAGRDAEQSYQHLKDLEFQKATARASGLTQAAKLQLDADTKAANIKWKRDYLAWQKVNKAADRATKRAAQAQTASHNKATENQAAANEAGRNSRAAKAQAAQNTRAAATRKASKAAGGGKGIPDASLSRVYGYVVDKYGNPVKKNGKKQPVAKTGSGKGGPPKGLGGH